jgi:putative transposase
MTNYRRACTAGATYFFTVNLADRTSALLTDCIDELRDAVRHVQLRHPFAIDAMVVLPNTCTPSGRCRRTMPTIPCDGG